MKSEKIAKFIKVRHRKRKSNKQNFTKWSLIALPVCALFIYFLLKKSNDWINCAAHDHFHIDIPDGYQIHGFDISKYQGDINWGAVQLMQDQGVSLQFVFVKATQGERNYDKNFDKNWQTAKDFKFARGAYHFYNPNEDPKLQAQNFIKHVQLLSGDLPPVLDIELLGTSDAKSLVQNLSIWLDTISAHYKVKPIIYSNSHFYETYLDSLGAKYPVWVAHYKQPIAPKIKRKWQFWQHSESGFIDGICGKVDFNIFNGSKASFDSLKIK